MIAHLSIDASNPERVARIISELWRGKVLPFPVVAGGWIVLADDDRGSAIEIYPRSTEMTPGVGQPPESSPTDSAALQPHEVQPRRGSGEREYGATHVAMQTPLEENDIHNIARREGWRSVTCDRGPAFRVVEFWLENRILIELLTPSNIDRYKKFMRSSVAGRLLDPQNS